MMYRIKEMNNDNKNHNGILELNQKLSLELEEKNQEILDFSGKIQEI